MKKAALMIICVTLCALAARAQTPTDVPIDHWAYGAVNNLAEKGYVNGYPDGKFLGNRTLTRYEFATIVKRVVDSLEARAANVEGLTTAADKAPVPAVIPAPAGVSAEDLADVRKLLDEFKVELTVIGTRLDRVETNLAELTAKVDSVSAIVTDPEGAVESTRADLAKLKKVTVSGYVQTRYQTLQNPEDKKALHTDDTFRVRRARVKVTARPSDKSMAVIQIDAGDDKASIKDAYVQYNSATDQLLGPSYLVGQQNWWFGYEVSYSSSKRETPERALFVRRFFPGERDRGAVTTAPLGKQWFATLGLYDGSGIDTVNTVSNLFVGPEPGSFKNVTTGSSSVGRDYNSPKDVLLNVKYSSPNMEFGVSGYDGKGIWNNARTFMDNNTDKIRYGADFRYYWDRVTLKTEYIRARGVDQTDVANFNPDKWVDGYYAQMNLNVTRADELVARYESLSQDPVYPLLGRRSAWNLGYIRFIDDNQKFKLFYQINEEENKSFPGNSFIAEWLVTY